jgi:hypothetical protein
MGEENNAVIARCSDSSKDGRVTRDDEFAKTVYRQEGSCTEKSSLSQLIDEHCNPHIVREDQLASPPRTLQNAMIRAEIAIMHSNLVSLHCMMFLCTLIARNQR